MVTKKRKTASWKPFWSWITYTFIAAVGITFLVSGFLDQNNNIMRAFLEYFIGIILLSSSIQKVKYKS
jgi:hypothetical protein